MDNTAVIIWHNGVETARVADSNAAFAYLIRAQGHSTDYACQYGGWKVTDLDGNLIDGFPAEVPEDEIENDNNAPVFIVNGSDGITGVWHGGPYVSLYWTEAYERRAEDCVAFNAIHVYDQETGEFRVSTREDVARELSEWIETNRGDLGSWLEHSL